MKSCRHTGRWYAYLTLTLDPPDDRDGFAPEGPSDDDDDDPECPFAVTTPPTPGMVSPEALEPSPVPSRLMAL